MEILESIPWVILGFIPTLATLEIYRRITNRTTTGKNLEGYLPLKDK